MLLPGLVVLGAVFGPGLQSFGSRFFGIEEVDYFGTLWFYDFAANALQQGAWRDPESFGHTDLFFHPWGKDVFLHTGANVLDAIVAAPLWLALGPVVGFNLWLVGMVATNAAAMAWAARPVVPDAATRWLAGLLFALSPFCLYELAEGRPTQGILAGVALFVGLIWRGGWLRSVGAGVVLALVAYQYWYYAFFCGVLALGHGLWGLKPTKIAQHALVAAVAFVLVAPVALPLAAAAAEGEAPGLLDTSLWTAAAVEAVTVEDHEVALMTFQPWLRQSGFSLHEDGVQRFIGHQRQLSWALLALVAVWLVKPGPLKRGPVLAAAVPLLVIAPGPLLVLGEAFVVNLPYKALAEQLPFARRLWWPARALGPALVVGGLVMAVALSRIGWLRWVVAALWIWDLRVSGLQPMPTWDASIPAGYRCLAEGPEGALIELPYGWTQAHLWYQTAHERPILGGMLERNPVFQPPEASALRSDNGLLAAIIADTGGPKVPDDYDQDDLQQLYDLGYRYVVLQLDAMFSGSSDDARFRQARRTQLRRVRYNTQQRLGSPVYADERIMIFAPWGDPRPCGEIDEDEEPRSGTRGLATSSVIMLPTVDLAPWGQDR